jgi:hypothetical protein
MVRNRARLTMLLGVVLGALLTSALVVRTTEAAFTGYTSTPSNSWASGGAQISNDQTASAIFSQANDGLLTGGQQISRCIVVSYQGQSTPAQVKLYGTTSGTLASALSLVVDQGSGTPGNGSCTGFAAATGGTGSYTGTVAGLGTDFAHGSGTWAPTLGATMTYRFTITVQNTSAAQNATASAVFTWEAQA